MTRRKAGRLIAVIFYFVVFLLVAFHQDMLAMYGMAVGMLAEALMQFIQK
ncbi:hypothetical protein [Levilactobacillus tongjiangensis]|uniref:Uncharacterized protein n=1 Tax=Levilactobacillus tongjiangensis TaxID=2486023 RepID=A0ABW1SW09_9LACO|nr:hypothetical protein [Levilactobacillus tongjiangensis]